MKPTYKYFLKFYRSGKEYRWRLIAANGRIIASGESFKRWSACVDSAAKATGYDSRDDIRWCDLED